jgi:hypothetical protein
VLTLKQFFTEPLVWLKGAIIFIIGPLDLHLSYLLLAVSVDLVFGIQVALKQKDFTWSALISKFGKKLKIYILWMVMFHAGLPDTARWSLIVLLTGMEILSAIKNTSKLGYGRLADALENLYLSLLKGGEHHEKHNERRVEEIEVRVEIKSDDRDTL